jgi:hypothetical protein
MAANGLELSCPAARASVASFSRILAGKSRSNFPHASRVSCSELFGEPHDLPSVLPLSPHGNRRLIRTSARRRPRIRLGGLGAPAHTPQPA